MAYADIDDEYAANLLKKEAVTISPNYQYSSRNTNFKSKPRPNTRFLKNIVREADSHNAALITRETSESKTRLISLDRQNYEDSDLRPHFHSDHLKKQSERGKFDGRYKPHHSQHKLHRSSRRVRGPRNCSKDMPLGSSKHCAQGGQKFRDRPVYQREWSKDGLNHRGHIWSPNREISTPVIDLVAENSRTATFDENDEFIGPLPAPHPRGRGTMNSGATIDKHFREHYDPKMDIHHDSPKEMSWDAAVERYRDHQKWRQQGAERLRSAGFDEAFIVAWENNSTNDETTLKWAKKGDTREWDKGKVVENCNGKVWARKSWLSM